MFKKISPIFVSSSFLLATVFFVFFMFFAIDTFFIKKYQALATPVFIDAKADKNKADKQYIDNLFKSIKLQENVAEPRVEFWGTEKTPYILKDFRGKFVILYFFATWCVNCMDELQSLDKLKSELIYQDINDIEIIPVSVDFKEIIEIEKTFKNRNIKNLKVYRDSHKELMGAMDVTSLPATFFINKEGYITSRIDKNIKWDGEPMINKLKVERGPEVAVKQKKNDSEAESNIIPEKKKHKTTILQ